MLASVFRTVIVYVAVITAMRLMGKRQLGELQPAELVTTFLISNVASICIDEPDLPLAASISAGDFELYSGLVLSPVCAAAVRQADHRHCAG